MFTHRKVWIGLLVFLFTVCLCFAAGAASSGTCGTDLRWTLDDDGHLTISGTGTMTSHPWDAESVKSVTIGSGATTIAAEAFEHSKITTAKIPGSVKTIGRSAFCNCYYLTSVSLPSGLAVIGAEAFLGCYKLPSITIPKGVTKIGQNAFDFCDGLEKITVASGNASYSSAGGVLYDKAKTKLIWYPKGLTAASLSIPGTVTAIESRAIRNNPYLTKITIPASVASVGESNYFLCRNLTEFIVAEGNKKYSSAEGVLFNKDKTTLIQCPPGKKGSYTVPAGVKKIWDKAFNESKLTGIRIPNSVTGIGMGAFNWCRSLKTMKFPSRITSIRSHMCENCGRLTAVWIPEDVTKISRFAFWDCDSLKDVYYQGTKDDRKAITIETGNEKLLKAAWHYEYTFTDASFKYQINEDCTEATVTGLASASITAVKIPDTVTVGGIRLKVTGIGANAFKGKTKLRTAAIGTYVEFIGNNAFSGCVSLEKVTGMRMVKHIGNTAFQKCTKLSAFTIQANVAEIGKHAFYGCSSLKAVTIKSVKLTDRTVGDGAFAKNPADAVYTCPPSKLKDYKILLPKKGVAKTATIK